MNIKDYWAARWEFNAVSLLDTFVVQQDFFQPLMLSSQMGLAGRVPYFWIAFFAAYILGLRFSNGLSVWSALQSEEISQRFNFCVWMCAKYSSMTPPIQKKPHKLTNKQTKNRVNSCSCPTYFAPERSIGLTNGRRGCWVSKLSHRQYPSIAANCCFSSISVTPSGATENFLLHRQAARACFHETNWWCLACKKKKRCSGNMKMTLQVF